MLNQFPQGVAGRRALIGFGVLAAWVGPAVSRQILRLGGTGAAQATMHLLGQDWAQLQHDRGLHIVPNLGSSGALRALTASALDLAVISRPLQREEIAQGLREWAYARTPFVFVANRTHDDERLDSLGVAKILAMQRVRWPDGSPLRLILRPPTDGDTQLLRAYDPLWRQALDHTQKHPGLSIALTDQDAVDRMERVPGSFGFSTLGLLMAEQRKLKVLSFEGVRPNLESVRQRAYRLVKTLRVVYREPMSDAVAGFIAYVGSPNGRRLLENFGQIPLNGHEA